MNRRDVFRRLFLLPGAVALPAALPGERGACPVVHVNLDSALLDDRAVQRLADKLVPEFCRRIALNRGGAYAKARLTRSTSSPATSTPEKKV